MRTVLVIVCLLLCSVAYAIEPFNVVMSAKATTGTSSSVEMPGAITCEYAITGTAPTSLLFTVEGSVTGDKYGTLATINTTTTGDIFHIDKDQNFVRGNYVSKVAGDATTALTISCKKWGKR